MTTMTTSTSRRSSSDPDARSGRHIRTLLTAGAVVRVLTSVRDDGDMHPRRVAPAALERRRRSLVDLPWTMLDQQHGVGVVRVQTPGEGDRRCGDVAVLETDAAAVGVWAADCAPVVIVASDGRAAVVHAGWRGLAEGVLDVACAALGAGASTAAAVLGPCIRPCCYEFGPSDLEAVAEGAGVPVAAISGVTRDGRRALDVPATVREALGRRGIAVVDDGVCTACDPRWFSHRRGDPERHVLAVWSERTS